MSHMGSYANGAGGTTHMPPFVNPSPSGGGVSYWGNAFPGSVYWGGDFPHGGGSGVVHPHMPSYAQPGALHPHMPSYVNP